MRKAWKQKIDNTSSDTFHGRYSGSTNRMNVRGQKLRLRCGVRQRRCIALIAPTRVSQELSPCPNNADVALPFSCSGHNNLPRAAIYAQYLHIRCQSIAKERFQSGQTNWGIDRTENSTHVANENSKSQQKSSIYRVAKTSQRQRFAPRRTC